MFLKCAFVCVSICLLRFAFSVQELSAGCAELKKCFKPLERTYLFDQGNSTFEEAFTATCQNLTAVAICFNNTFRSCLDSDITNISLMLKVVSEIVCVQKIQDIATLYNSPCIKAWDIYNTKYYTEAGRCLHNPEQEVLRMQHGRFPGCKQFAISPQQVLGDEVGYCKHIYLEDQCGEGYARHIWKLLHWKHAYYAFTRNVRPFNFNASLYI